ncbi:MAG: helix-turn-helix domain-containing protein [Gammaproteobacteria bacterium]|nr:helix-turn-helix domain-containing protein [Gammaproteobacteria bacterium]
MTEEFKLGYSEDAEDITKTSTFFADLSDIIRVEGSKLGLEKDVLEEIAANTSIEITKMYAYNNIYIPKKPLQILRQIKIFNAMRKGIPVEDIAREYDVSQQWVYRIYKDMQAKHIKRIQRDLF